MDTPPLFKRYTIETLARRSGYNPHYLLWLQEHPEIISPLFRRRMAHRLRRTEEDLFGPPLALSEPE